VFENEYIKMVWSPATPESSWRANVSTWCGYQSIERNTPGRGKKTYTMPGHFDVRIKDESGPITAFDDDGVTGHYSPNDDDLDESMDGQRHAEALCDERDRQHDDAESDR